MRITDSKTEINIHDYPSDKRKDSVNVEETAAVDEPGDSLIPSDQVLHNK